MNVLVACEYSGRVRDAFTKKGHFAVSCDFLMSEQPGNHVVADVLDLLNMPGQWDMLLSFPPCTYLASSGARWWAGKKQEQLNALAFVYQLLHAKIDKIALENPIGRISTAIRKPDQIVQPWQFGHGETKSTCLWLKGLPLLQPSKIVSGREPRIHMLPPTSDRGKLRSLTYQGIADAMADQWG